MQAGVIGLGFMGAAHVAAIESYADAELVAVAGRDAKTRAGDFSQVGGNLETGPRQFNFSGVRTYSQWQELVADARVEAVSICLPTSFHAAVTVAALESGKHVLCEKPMALAASDCERMMEAARKAQRTLMIGHVLRFWPEYQALGEFVAQARVRQATFIRRCGTPEWRAWLADETQSGGAVMDLLIHDIDQILLLFGMPERVTAKRLGTTDAVMASFLYPSGPEVRLQGGWFAPEVPFSMSFQVRGDAGEMELNANGLTRVDLQGARSEVAVPQANAYAAEMHYFLDCCRTGAPPLRCPAGDSAQAVSVALAVKESRARDGEQIRCLV